MVLGFAPRCASAADGEFPAPEKQMEIWYKAHAEGKGPFLDESKKQFWEMMFGEDLVKALKSQPWGFDPLYFAQDSDVKDVKTTRIGELDQPNALVLVSFKNFDHAVSVVAYMEVTDTGWRLINLVKPDDGTSLIRDLSGD